MSKPQSNIQRLYEDIRQDYEAMSSEKEFGVQKYRTSYILAYLGHKYYRSPKTIENIVFYRTTYATNQLGLDFDQGKS